eukprot:5569135-Alexandrium_andersonii.AAC.1
MGGRKDGRCKDAKRDATPPGPWARAMPEPCRAMARQWRQKCTPRGPPEESLRTVNCIRYGPRGMRFMRHPRSSSSTPNKCGVVAYVTYG